MPYLTLGGSDALTPVFCSIATHGPILSLVEPDPLKIGDEPVELAPVIT